MLITKIIRGIGLHEKEDMIIMGISVQNRKYSSIEQMRKK